MGESLRRLRFFFLEEVVLFSFQLVHMDVIGEWEANSASL